MIFSSKVMQNPKDENSMNYRIAVSTAIFISISNASYSQEAGNIESPGFTTSQTATTAIMPNAIGLNRDEVLEEIWNKRGIRITGSGSGQSTCEANLVTGQIPKEGFRFSSKFDFAMLRYGSFEVTMPKPRETGPFSNGIDRYFFEFLEDHRFIVNLTQTGPGAAPRTEPGYCAYVKATYKLSPAAGTNVCPGSNVSVNVRKGWAVYDCR